MPDTLIDFKTPYKKWHGHKPDLTRLIPFGCCAVVHQDFSHTGSKVAPSGVEAIFINFDGTNHSYKLWVPTTDRMVITHHVFFSDMFPLKSGFPPPMLNTPQVNLPVLEEMLIDLGFLLSQGQPDPPIEADSPKPDNLSPAPDSQPAPEATGIPSTSKGYTYVPYFDQNMSCW